MRLKPEDQGKREREWNPIFLQKGLEVEYET